MQVETVRYLFLVVLNYMYIMRKDTWLSPPTNVCIPEQQTLEIGLRMANVNSLLLYNSGTFDIMGS